MAEKKWLLDFQGVQIARHEHILFEQLDLQVAAGEFVYLTGPVGSGKSTLLKTISAEVPLSKGKASVMGFNLSRIKSKELPKLRRRLGIVFQNFQLLPDQTVHDNLDIVLRAFGVSRSSERESLINEALQDVGLETKSYKYSRHHGHAQPSGSRVLPRSLYCPRYALRPERAYSPIPSTRTP